MGKDNEALAVFLDSRRQQAAANARMARATKIQNENKPDYVIRYRAWMDREQRRLGVVDPTWDPARRRPGKLINIGPGDVPTPPRVAAPVAAVTTCPRCGAAVCTGHRRITLP
jgi:hypothetical protein